MRLFLGGASLSCKNRSGCDRMKKTQNKTRHPADILLLAGAIAVGAIILLIALLQGQGGTYVQVRVDSSVYGTYPLSESRTVRIDGIGGSNTLVIENGQAWMSEADCPDKLCVRQGTIRLKGQSIICLPHKTVVEIVSDEQGDSASAGVDIIAK